MARLLITTVGTSLLTNRDDRPWAGWNRHANDPLPDAAHVDRWLETADPILASAETNTLRSIEAATTDHALLLHSDTPEGRFCSDRLHYFCSDVVRCRHVEARPLRALGYGGPKFQEGLKVLVNEAIKAVHGAQGKSLEPVFCATGGFKAEIAFLNVLGALLNVEVIYIHEQFRKIVRLPRLPLNWKADWVLQRREFFEWISGDLRSSAEVDNRLKADPELQPFVEDAGNGFSYLNAAGELLFKAACEVGSRADWPPPASELPPGEKSGLSGVPHHRPKGWEKFVNRLCDVDWVSRVSYDGAASGGAEVKVLSASEGAIGVRWGSAGDVLPLRVETTARGAAQTEIVRDYITNNILRG